MQDIAYPVQIQANNCCADDSHVPCMCHVFDNNGLVTVFNTLCNNYLHVVAWDNNGSLVRYYDNR
jgi:hypothetical protein